MIDWFKKSCPAVALVVTAVALALAAPVNAEYGIDPASAVSRAHPKIPLVHATPCNVSRTRCALSDLPGILALAPEDQAGAHLDASGGARLMTQGVQTRDFVVEAPPGFVGNLTAVPACDRELFSNSAGQEFDSRECPPVSQVGVATTDPTGNAIQTAPMYRLTRTPGFSASFGFVYANIPVVVNASVRTDGDYGISVAATDISGLDALEATTVTLWGIPADPHNDPDRWDPTKLAPSLSNPNARGDWGVSSGLSRVPLIQLPADCSNGALVTALRVRAWQEPGRWLPDSLPAVDPRRADYVVPAPRPTGCELLSFDPSLALQPGSRRADSPTGASVTLRIPQNQDPDGLATPPLKRAVVTLPEDVTLNPSAADGLQGCTTEQIGLTTTSGAYPNPIRFAKYVDEAGKVAERCPDASKVGTATVVSPALEDPLPGDVYVAQPFDNPFGSLFAMYLVVRGPGFTAKLPGLIETDPDTGRVTTTFDHSPQLPVESVELDLFGGARAPLATSRTCGERTTETVLTPWSYPQSGPPATPASSFQVEGGPDGLSCPTGLGGRPFDLGFSAGSVNPIAGSASPFVVRLERGDGRQELDRVVVTTPRGLAADLSRVPYCPEAAIAQAIARDSSGDGAAERANPSCPASSRVGSTTIGAGAGSSPYYVSGDVYLAGSYEGAPLSLVFVVPAVAGPFDLGVQVVRAAVQVDRRTAEVTTASDTIPKILEGVPLRVRDVRVEIDRPGFTVNPSSCAEQRIGGTAHGSQGAQTALGSRFQVADCASLPFKPRLALRLTGRKQIKTGRHPGVRAQVNQTGIGEAGIKKAVVRLPKSLALDPDNAQSLCEFADGTADDPENRCPKGSIVGRARAVSPLLKRPLAGNVYFVKNVRRDPRTGNLIRTLPMIVVALRGEIAINLYGKSSTTAGGKLVNTFASVPDAPISRFNLNIAGGKAGILAVTQTRKGRINLCTKPRSHVAEVDTDGQNGKRHDFDVRMKTPCTKKQIKAAKRKAATRAKRAAARRR